MIKVTRVVGSWPRVVANTTVFHVGGHLHKHVKYV